MTGTEAPEALRCPRCQTAMNREQDWCLECGFAATTRVVPPPSWGLPLAVVAIVAALVGLLLALTVGVLSDDAEKAVNRGATSPSPAATTTAARRARPPAVASTPTETVPGAAEATGSGPVPLWPGSQSAYAVILTVTDDRGEAEKRAREVIRQGGQDAGILPTEKYDFFTPGQWAVWVGQYPDRPTAEAALQKAGASADGAYVTLVRPLSSGQ
ncbi:MAG: hypothetical protein ACR2NH_12400 [Solirubrobacteraceae bacterium]